MKNTLKLSLSLTLLMATASTAQGTELHLTLGGQAFSDPAYGLVSDDSTVTMVGVRANRATGFDSKLTWLAAYEFGSTNDYAYHYGTDQESTDVWTSLNMHAMEFGLRAGYPIGRRLAPYAAFGVRAVGGFVTVEDTLTGWSVDDPADPTGQDTLYELEPERDFGLSLGLQGALGLAIRLGQDSETTTVQNEDATSEDAPISNRHAPEWGLYAEAGYTLQTAIRFTNSGSLGLGGPRLLMGAFVVF